MVSFSFEQYFARLSCWIIYLLLCGRGLGLTTVSFRLTKTASLSVSLVSQTVTRLILVSLCVIIDRIFPSHFWERTAV